MKGLYSRENVERIVQQGKCGKDCTAGKMWKGLYRMERIIQHGKCGEDYTAVEKVEKVCT